MAGDAEFFLERDVGEKGNRSGVAVRPAIWTATRKEYDFSRPRKNPYASQLKTPVTIRLDQASVAYFKEVSEEVGISYQSLINLDLHECAASHRELELRWKQISVERIANAASRGR